MQGHHTLWVPGTDHAGIATQVSARPRVIAFEITLRRRR